MPRPEGTRFEPVAISQERFLSLWTQLRQARERDELTLDDIRFILRTLGYWGMVVRTSQTWLQQEATKKEHST